MLGVYRKKILVFSTCIFIILNVSKTFGQRGYSFQSDYDEKPIHFGFFLGTAFDHYVVNLNRAYLDPSINTGPNAVNKMTSTTKFPIKAGASINYHINENFDFRFSPVAITLYSRNLEANEIKIMKKSTKAWLELPAMIKYKGLRRDNTRMFMFFGMKYGLETNVVNRKTKSPFKSHDFSIDYGAGLDI